MAIYAFKKEEKDNQKNIQTKKKTRQCHCYKRKKTMNQQQ